MRTRTGQGGGKLGRDAFAARFRERFSDPAFDAEREAILRLEEIAWSAYCASRKAPRKRLAGAEFSEPGYELSVDWLEARARIDSAARRHADRGAPTRVLVVVGSSRNDDTCPSEASKTFRMAGIARDAIASENGAEVDLLDLSTVTSEPHRHIHPCKGCVSTAMPLCHWPCSCYPNHSLQQTGDWMNEIYERWVAAHGVLIVSPVYWYQVPGQPKAMMDRLVCADGGNPDPTTTRGKDPRLAKELELAGWGYPKHLAGRVFGVVVHGDAVGAEGVRRALAEWLETMGLVAAGGAASLDRYVGYYEPYATSHDALDRDEAFQDEVRNAARAVSRAAALLRGGRLPAPDAGLVDPRPK
jgi:multimeric flavodoxin WrbA